MMHHPLSVLYLITARGGSKGVPRKNLCTIGGRSLISYKAIAARKAASCSRLIISSDDAEIIEEAQKYGAEALFVRPPELASDTANSVDVVLHTMEWIERHEGRAYDAVMLLEPASPFATAEHFDQAVAMMQEKRANLVVGVRQTEVASVFTGQMDQEGSIGTVIDKIKRMKNLRRQDQAMEVTPNGALYLLSWPFLKQNRAIYADEQHSYGLLMPEAYSLEIETPLDLAYGEFLIQRQEVDVGLWEVTDKDKKEPEQGENYSKRLHNVIPGGAHTYSRGDDQYPQNAPPILKRGKGAYVWAPQGACFLDYGMALRAVTIGYAEPAINQAALRQIDYGNNLTRASVIELKAAELLVSLVDSVDMVKFTKNGSTATSAAVKLARAYTGRDMIARCAQHPFFSYDDWFIGNTPIKRGIPKNIQEQTKSFTYNDISSLERLIDQHPNQFACVILEPAALECPTNAKGDPGCCQKAVCDRYTPGADNYLKQVEALCRKHGIVFILDEMITGFRWDIKGAQALFGVTPDLCTFGKAMANGFSVAAVAGRREIMQLGSTDRPGMERLFLLSTTHGAEMSGLGAFVETVHFLEREQVIRYLWQYGERIVTMMKQTAQQADIQKHFAMIGPVISPAYVFYDYEGNVSLPLRTLFLQELIKHGVLMPWLAFCYRHGDAEFDITQNAVAQAMQVIRLALDEGIDKYLIGPVVKPVFRQFN